MVKKEYISPEINVHFLEVMSILEISDPSKWDIIVPTEDNPLYGDDNQEEDEEDESL